MTDRIEIQGKTVEAAVSEALLQMGARRDEVEIKVLEEPRSGFMGFLGGRAARVLVRKKRTRGRGGASADHRVDDGDYQAHNLGRGRGRKRGGSRSRPSSGSSEDKGDARQASRQPNREEKSDSRRGSRGRGGRSRGQEASTRGQKQGSRRDQKPTQKSTQKSKQDSKQEGKQDRNQIQGSGRRSDGRRSRGGGRDGRQEKRSRAPKESTRPVSGGREDIPTREETPIRPLRQEPHRSAGAPAAPEVHQEPKPITPKEETTVTKPAKPRRSFGGLGSRIKEKRAAAKAAEVEKTTKENPTQTNEPPVENPGPTAPASRDHMSSNNPAPGRPTQERRSPSFVSSRAGEELILGGIKGTRYAQPIGSVNEDGLDDALNQLTDAMLARAGFPCRCETFPGEYRQVKVTTDEASAGMLIGRHGQTVDAVEHLVERMASNAIDARARVNLDINNYRMRREEMLVERVAEAAGRIRESGRPFHMEPMSGRERRIVHLETAALGGLRTFTVDGSGGKHVVIALEEGTPQGDQSQDEKPLADQPDQVTDELNDSDA